MAVVGWGVTGAGHFLFDTFDAMEKIADDHKLSCYLSEAGERVVRLYGLWGRLQKICPGGYYRETVLGSKQGASSPLSGRFQRGRYEVLIVSPTTTNTVAKAARGIADTLVTNTISHARKGTVPILVVPTNKSGREVSELPYVVNREICRRELGRSHEECQILDACPYGAIVEAEDLPRIDMTKCEGCGACLEDCPYGAVSFREEIGTNVERIDLDNLEKLKKISNVVVLNRPEEIIRTLEEAL